MVIVCLGLILIYLVVISEILVGLAGLKHPVVVRKRKAFLDCQRASFRRV